VLCDQHLRIEAIFGAVREDFESEPVQFNREPEHAHPLLTSPPKVTVARLLNSLEGSSSRRMRHKFPELARHHLRARRPSSDSYLAGSLAGTPPTARRT
jgi:putative transposase